MEASPAGAYSSPTTEMAELPELCLSRDDGPGLRERAWPPPDAPKESRRRCSDAVEDVACDVGRLRVVGNVLCPAKVGEAAYRLRPTAGLRPIAPEALHHLRRPNTSGASPTRQVRERLSNGVTFLKKTRLDFSRKSRADAFTQHVAAFPTKHAYLEISSKERSLLYQWLRQTFPDSPFKMRDMVVTVKMHGACAVEHDAPPEGEWSAELIFPYFEVVILGRETPLSRCCLAPYLVYFDVLDGALLSCCASTCSEPILHMRSFPQGWRESLWSKWARCYGGTLPPMRRASDLQPVSQPRAASPEARSFSPADTIPAEASEALYTWEDDENHPMVEALLTQERSDQKELRPNAPPGQIPVCDRFPGWTALSQPRAPDTQQ